MNQQASYIQFEFVMYVYLPLHGEGALFFFWDVNFCATLNY